MEIPPKRHTFPLEPCGVCQDLRPDLLHPEPWYTDKGSNSRRSRPKAWLAHDDLVSSRKRGCKICNLILCASEVYYPQKTPTFIVVKVRPKDKILQKFDSLIISPRFLMTKKEWREWKKEDGRDSDNDEDEEPEDEGEKPKLWEGVDLQLYEEKGSPAGLQIGQARAVSRYSRFSTCMDLLYSWLSQCRDNHEACSDPPDVTLPTRVISVGSETTLPHLYIPGKGTRGQYAALSHCWGGDVALKTTISNIKEHQHGIPEDQLPKTFSDAIYIARKLQIQYLWIDSLCIVQDAGEDWARESGRMGSYYSGAILTISADCAANSSEGCFKERPFSAWNFIRIEKHQTGLRNDVCVRLAPQELYHSLGHTFETSKGRGFVLKQISRSHLHERAWALQEWVLSKRIVHFTSEELVWECQQEATCECHVGEDKNRGGMVRKKTFKSLVDDFPALYVQWMDIVCDFSERLITYETDRLPAIAGVAEVFSKVSKDEYVCGIWKNCPSTLAWEPAPGGFALHQDRFYAPSWSWASIATPINRTYLRRYKDLKYRGLAEILNIDSVPATTNRFGPVKKYATLTIRGHVFPGRCRKLEPIGGYNEHRFFIGKHLSKGAIQMDFPPVPPDEFWPPWRIKLLPKDRSRVKPDLHPGDRFVVLVVDQMSEKVRRKASQASGLVLKAVDESESIYRRVGTYSGDYWRPWTPEWVHSKERTITLV